MTLLGWFVLVETDSPWLVGLVGFFGMIPMFVLGVLGGVLADAVDRRRLLLTTQAAALLSLVSLSTLMVLDLAVYWHAYPAILVMGIAWALDMPSRRSLIHDLLGRRRVTNGVALDSMGMSASMMIGPATAGALIDRVGVTGGYLVVTVLSLTSIVLLSRLGTGQARPPQYDVGIPPQPCRRVTLRGRTLCPQGDGVDYGPGEPAALPLHAHGPRNGPRGARSRPHTHGAAAGCARHGVIRRRRGHRLPHTADASRPGHAGGNADRVCRAANLLANRRSTPSRCRRSWSWASGNPGSARCRRR